MIGPYLNKNRELREFLFCELFSEPMKKRAISDS